LAQNHKECNSRDIIYYWHDDGIALMVTCSPFINIYHTDVDVDVRELELVKTAHASVQSA